MLSPEILEALKGYTENLSRPVTLVLGPGEHPKRGELKAFLDKFCSVSDLLVLEEREQAGGFRSALSFSIEAGGEPTGITFSGIPGGHEFNSMVLAVLNAGGTPIKLDDQVRGMVASLEEPLKFEVFVSLSCHNCPDVVQALNQFALVNPRISSEMIDGGEFPDLVEERDLQGVPAVFLNGEPFANGKVDIAALIEKLQARYPEMAPSQASVESLPLQDVTVIGGGPAGVSAAIYAARKGLAVTLVAERLGGQVKDTMGIENLISVSSTTGPKLTGDLQQHMQDYDMTVREHLRVEKVESGDTKAVHLSSGERIDTRTLIIATGAKWRELGVPGEKENIGNGVAYCPHCDGPFFKGKDVAVVGGGNSGVEAALDLAGIANSVTVLEFMAELKADQVLVDQANATANIQILTGVAVEEVLAEGGKVSGLRYLDRDSEQTVDLDVDGIFVQIGLLPNSEVFRDVVELSQHGEVMISERGETSSPGIFACGDVTTVPYKQIVVALGEGAKASLAAFDYLIRNSVGKAA